jgi:hypothetical protein
MKNKKKEEEQRKLETGKKSVSLSHNISKNTMHDKLKVSSQPAYDEEDNDHIKTRAKIKQIGDSIVVINRK